MSSTPISVGPVDFFVLRFPGNHFRGEIVPAIQALVDAGTIRVIDILFAVREGEAEVRVLELAEIPSDVFARFDPVVAEVTGIMTPDDVQKLSVDMEPDSTMALLLFENTWARKVADAIEAADGEVVLFERIPRPVVQQLIEEREALLAEGASA
jgi:hypothetical protein